MSMQPHLMDLQGVSLLHQHFTSFNISFGTSSILSGTVTGTRNLEVSASQPYRRGSKIAFSITAWVLFEPRLEAYEVLAWLAI